MNNTNLPSLSDLWLDYNDDLALAAADCRRPTLPPLRPWPRPATPPPPIPAPLPRPWPGPRMATVNPPPIADTVPARGGHRRGASKAKAKIKAKGGKALGRAARGGSSPRNNLQHTTSLDPELNLSSEAGRRSMLVGTRDGEQRRGRGGGAGRRTRGKLVVHQYEFMVQPDGLLLLNIANGDFRTQCRHARVKRREGKSLSNVGYYCINISINSRGTSLDPIFFVREPLPGVPHDLWICRPCKDRGGTGEPISVTMQLHRDDPSPTVRTFKLQALLLPRTLNPPRHGSNTQEAYSALARKKNISSRELCPTSKAARRRMLGPIIPRDAAMVELFRNSWGNPLEAMGGGVDRSLRKMIHAMRPGDTFLLDEISLADDPVLEHLNSVLEPACNIVLAGRGGFDVEHAEVAADPNFKLLATMSPGGDYGKKALSPAPRNRFTEIWVPQSWRHECLFIYTDAILTFTEWLASAVNVASVASLWDILAWVNSANEVLGFHALLPTNLITLDRLVPRGNHRDQVFDATVLSTSTHVYVGSFGIPKGGLDIAHNLFSLQAPTTLDNVRRLVLRACQLSRPILLKASPGVGKTSLVVALVVALGDMIGRRVVVSIYRIKPTSWIYLALIFQWKVVALAMQGGDVVLLDEMNLAPQTVLEGLNAVLDHRGSIHPQTWTVFHQAPSILDFRCSNGGGKGLPKSSLDRFTKVHIKALMAEDLFGICHQSI
ncbi:hypothetical protein JB92DRAFT_3093582 [Gautieria morchelliformis]|nr:hypothetical protein JB92DRAFT_3093582 [Gautieria morchelliformis]